MESVFCCVATRLFTLLGWSVGWLAFLSFSSIWLLPRYPSDLLQHCSCPPARDCATAVYPALFFPFLHIFLKLASYYIWSILIDHFHLIYHYWLYDCCHYFCHCCCFHHLSRRFHRCFHHFFVVTIVVFVIIIGVNAVVVFVWICSQRSATMCHRAPWLIQWHISWKMIWYLIFYNTIDKKR